MPMMTQKEYANHRGVTEGAISQAIKSGKIRKENNSLLDSGKCDDVWQLRPEQIARRDAKAATVESPPQASQAKPESIFSDFEDVQPKRGGRQFGETNTEAINRLTIANKQADLDGKELKNRRIRGDLISRRVAVILCQSLAQVARQRIMAVPIATCHSLQNCTVPQMVEILTRALERALADTLTQLPDFVAADTDFGSDD